MSTMLSQEKTSTRDKVVRLVAQIILPVFWLTALQPASAGQYGSMRQTSQPSALSARGLSAGAGDFSFRASDALLSSTGILSAGAPAPALKGLLETPAASPPASPLEFADLTAKSMQFVEQADEERDANALESIAELTRLLQATGAQRPSSALAAERLSPSGGLDGLARLILDAAAPLDGLNTRFDQGLRDADSTLARAQISSAQPARTQAAINEFASKFSTFQSLIAQLKLATSANSDLSTALFNLRDFMAKNQASAGFEPIDPRQIRAQLPAEFSAKPPKLFENQIRSWASAQNLDFANAGIALRSTDSVTLAPPGPADLGESDEIQLTPMIRAKAAELANNPVKLLAYVRNNFEFAPIYGAAQSSQQMFLNRRGNAFDHSALLIALLRAANIPARFVYGAVELPAAKVQNWLGNVATPALALELMQRGQIPAAAVISGGTISAIRFEHVWVEAYVDFAPSRGSVNRQGSEWVPMDASLHQYSYTAPLNLSAQNIPTPQQTIGALVASGISGPEDSLTGVSFAAIELMGNRMDLARATLAVANPDLRLEDFVGKRILIPEVREILEGSTPFRVISSNVLSFAEVPNVYRYFLEVQYFNAYGDYAQGNTDMSHRISFARSYASPLSVDYIGATPADTAALTQYEVQNATSLVAATLNVKPVLKQGSQIIQTGAAARYGTERFAAAVVIGPDGEVFAPSKATSLPLGAIAEAGNDPGFISSWVYDEAEKQLPSGDASIQQMLHMGALLYWTASNAGEEIACRTNGTWCQRLPSAGWFASIPQTRYFFGIPRSSSFGGFQTDLPLIRIAHVAKTPELLRQAMLDLGLNGSFLEGSVWEQLQNLPSGQGASASAILIKANAARVPIYTITAATAAAILPRLQLGGDAMAEIRNALNANMTIIVPEREMQMDGNWRGAAWVALDPSTGAGAYRIAGGTSGAIVIGCLLKALHKKSRLMRRLVRKYNVMWARFARLGPGWSRLTAVGARVIGGVSQVMSSKFVYAHALHMVLTDAAIEAAGAFCPLDTDADDCLINLSPGPIAFRACWGRGGCGGGGSPGGGGGGSRGGGPLKGKPVDAAYGYEIWEETDYQAAAGPNPLKFVRTYISDVEGDYALGQRWRHNYEIKLEFDDQFAPDGRPLRTLLTLGNGDYYQYDYRGTKYFPVANVPGMLEPMGTGWRFTDEDDFVYLFNAVGVVQSISDRSGVAVTMSYDAEGFLDRVTDAFGRYLSFSYNEDGRLETLTDAQSRATHYDYNLKGRLELVTLADLKTRTYAYTDPRNSKLLTSITDERNIQLGSIHYNFQGRVDESSFAGGAEHHLFRYEDRATVITDALGTERRVEYVDINGELFQAKVSAPCSSCSAGGRAETTYNSAGYRTKTIDFRGNITTFNYNARGLLESQTDALGKPEARTTSTQWHSDFRLPVKITEPILGGSRVTDLTYAPNGTLLTRKVTAPNAAGLTESRIWTFTYNNFGQVLTEDGPRTDVNDLSSYSYNTDGNRASMTDALGHTTNYTSHDASGKVLRMTDANGLVTDYVYDQRDRLTDAKVKANATATIVETTHYDYTPTGSVDKLTLPDGSFLSYQYDDADRLVGISDNLGNSVSYTLNGNGDRTSDITKDANNVLAMTMSRAIDPLGRVQSVTGANIDEISSYSYDGNGNEKTALDPNSNLTKNDYDALDRITQVIDPNDITVGFKYDAQDNLLEVSDPRNLKTNYAYSGFDELKKLTSPDTAVTDYGYDIAGNLTTRKDARNITASYQYDAANRLKQISYPATPTVIPAQAGIQTAPAETIHLAYDEATGGPGAKGLLTTVSDASGNTKYQYDAFGRVTSKTQVVASNSAKTQTISYLPTGQLNEHTLPSGAIVKYSYRADGRVVSIQFNGVTIISELDYFPFGEVKSWKYGSNDSYTRVFDSDGRIKEHTSSSGVRKLAFDPGSRITGLTDQPASANDWTFDYDKLDRLKAAENGAIGANPIAQLKLGWTFDATGNRKTESRAIGSATPVVTNLTIDASSNKLTQVATLARTYDAAGNTINDGAIQSLYSARNRLMQVNKAGVQANYSYNAFGERVSKLVGGQTIEFVYDESGHLLGEYRAADATEVVWLGDTPLAVIKPSASTQGGMSAGSSKVYFVQPDHLDTPRLVVNAANQSVWSWNSAPFGDSLANEQPTASLAAFQFNLRFPGQQFDAETGTHYNYFRDYEAGTGRYLQSDPIGLEDGPAIFNYGGQDPVSLYDSRGTAKRGNRKREVQNNKNARDTTPPTLPPSRIIEECGVCVEHYYHSNDHAPPHAHVSGNGPDTTIGPNGNPRKGEPELSSTQRSVLEKHKSKIRAVINKIGRWCKWQSK